MKLGTTIPVIDVRSPGEFAHGHIPGAINIPVFDDEERARVGTCYKNKGQEPAIALGLEIVEPKLLDMAKAALAVARNSEVLLHCWRGGMRSASMADLFETAGINTHLLKGGYKTYRRYVLDGFAKKFNIRLVAGETGSGKTEILKALAEAGEQIVDLEEIASHRGSSFGAIGMNPQPTVENFENQLFATFRNLDPGRPVWLEAESRSIGRVFIPDPLWQQMLAAPVFRVQVPFEVRVQRLITDYGHFPKEILREALDRIKKRLGGLDYKNAMEALDRDDLAEATRLALRYYDKAYDHPHKVRDYANVQMIPCDDGDPFRNAQLILQAASKRIEC